MSAVSDRLPSFPWDRLEPYKKTAAAHPDGIVDLSVGTPVDPVPDLIQKALVDAADSRATRPSGAPRHCATRSPAGSDAGSAPAT